MSEQTIHDAGHHDELIIRINLEDVFHNRQCHPEDNDPGTVIYYVIKVDKKEFEVKQHALTGRQLLALVGLTPDKYRLFELGEGHKEILPDEYADFRKKGVERFKSVAKHANEGFEATPGVASPSLLRKSLPLLSEDEQYLNRNHPNWETVRDSGNGWIIIKDFRLPDGYNQQTTTLALLIPPSYPTVEFDMMYFFPAISRTDGKPIGALSTQALDGKAFQRWSRHRIAGEWRSGIDNLETHVLSINAWLIDELKKR